MGLSARLLLLTIGFVMISELMIYAPSISRFRKVYLEEMISRAHLAALALEGTADASVSMELKDELLFHAGAYAIVISRPERRLLVLSHDMPPQMDVTLDLRTQAVAAWFPDAIDTLVQRENRVLRVIGPSPKEAEVIVEVIMDETPMREAMYGYSTRILQLSIVISLITAGAVYLSLHWLLVRPMRRITDNMTAFQADPEDESRIIRPSDRSDEIGVAERTLAVMQRDVRAALAQKTRLATLGAAVAKINHDLRNSLATAMLVSDRLANINDPEVQRVTPRLYDAIDRAVTLCSQTLNYVGDGLPRLDRGRVGLRELVVRMVEEMSTPDPFELSNEDPLGIDVRTEMEPDLEVDGDAGQLLRVFGNLARNAAQAGAKTLVVRGWLDGDRAVVEVSDNGPGLPNKARDKLFQPFAGSARAGGTGLGLVIARDIVRAHGGDIRLAKTDSEGTTFRLELPTP